MLILLSRRIIESVNDNKTSQIFVILEKIKKKILQISINFIYPHVVR